MRVRDLAVSCAVVLCAVSLFAQEKLTAEDVVARHLESIGAATARAAVKSRTAQAATRMDMIVGGAAHAEGTAMMVSLGRQLSLQLKFPDRQYPDEQFVFDGKEVKIALTGPNTRSRLGDFLYRGEAVVRESLLGGTLLTSWALLDQRARQAKLKYQGLKKIENHELHGVAYFPKRADGNLQIHLYFEPETFRHVKTIYTFTVPPEMAPRDGRRPRVQALDRTDMRYRVEETFSDFRTVDGLTVPGHWKLQYTTEAGQTMSAAFDFTLGAIVHNNVVD
ncbi:MAG: hypothetical protein ACE14L_17325 [Terriglobales bacterium]